MKFRKITQWKCQILWFLELRISMKTIVISTANFKVRMGWVANMWNENDLGNLVDIAWHLLLFSHSVMLDHCYPMDCSPPSSSVHGIILARILEWIAISSSRGSSWARIEIASPADPALAGGFFTTKAIWTDQSQGSNPCPTMKA